MNVVLRVRLRNPAGGGGVSRNYYKKLLTDVASVPDVGDRVETPLDRRPLDVVARTWIGDRLETVELALEVPKVMYETVDMYRGSCDLLEGEGWTATR